VRDVRGERYNDTTSISHLGIIDRLNRILKLKPSTSNRQRARVSLPFSVPSRSLGMSTSSSNYVIISNYVSHHNYRKHKQSTYTQKDVSSTRTRKIPETRAAPLYAYGSPLRRSSFLLSIANRHPPSSSGASFVETAADTSV